MQVDPWNNDNVEGFDCGVQVLNDWFHNSIKTAAGHGTRTRIARIDGIIVGYYAVAPASLERETLPKKFGRGKPAQIPAMLLAKLAVAQESQGQGVGRGLLIEALDHILRSAKQAGGSLIVVDAVDESAGSFYEKHDFKPLPGNPSKYVMKMSSAAKALKHEWP